MNRLRWTALGDVWRHYVEVFRAAWANRKQQTSVHFSREEAAFLPANLELMETPVHPAPRWTMRVIIALVLAILLIAIFGKLSIVVVAHGKLIPNSDVKIIQPAVTGVVRAILVHDGQHVAAGQPLIRLDARQVGADVTTARTARVHAAFALDRARALVQATQHGHLAPIFPVPGASKLERQEAQALAEQTWQSYQDKLQAARDALEARKQNLASVRQEVAKLEATAPIAEQEAKIYQTLASTKDVSQVKYMDHERTADTEIHELRVKRKQVAQLKAEVSQGQASLLDLTSSFLQTQQLELDKATKNLTTYKDAVTKAVTQKSRRTLAAPIAGTVQQLATHTVGGVVTTAQSLLEIVPNETLRVKATVENRDVGFVRIGQRAVVKVAAFPYIHYGYLTGTVTGLSKDATHSKKRGSVYMVHVRLSRNRMFVNGHWVKLTPGMAVRVEIKTGRRRVLSYFLGPLLQHAQESLHER